MTVGLVQTGLLPVEKIPLDQDKQAFIPPLAQWKKIISYLAQNKDQKIDLIVLPEAAVPFGANLPLFLLETATVALQQGLGAKAFPLYSLPLHL